MIVIYVVHIAINRINIMAGYKDTRELIINTLMGRPVGTEIQPEDHQRFALQITEYIRSVELVAGNSTPIGFADASTVPVQPDNGQAVYLASVESGKTVTFANIASGLSVVKIGGRSSIPEYDEIMKYFLQKYPDEGTIEKETPPVIATEAGM